MDLVLPILEVDFVGFDLEQLHFPLLFDLVGCAATAHAAEGPKHVPPPYLLPPLLEGGLLLLYDFLALEQVVQALLQIPDLEPLFSSLLKEFGLREPIVP